MVYTPLVASAYTGSEICWSPINSAICLCVGAFRLSRPYAAPLAACPVAFGFAVTVTGSP